MSITILHNLEKLDSCSVSNSCDGGCKEQPVRLAHLTFINITASLLYTRSKLNLPNTQQ